MEAVRLSVRWADNLARQTYNSGQPGAAPVLKKGGQREVGGPEYLERQLK